MTLLFIFLLPIAEIWLLIEVASRYGIVNTFFAVLASFVLGAGIARSQGLFILKNLQSTVARGEIPTQAILQSVLVFVGGVLIMVPGFITDALGVLLVLPGTRHLFAWFMKKKIASNIQNGRFHVFAGGTGFAGSFGGQNPFGGGAEPFGRPQGPLRDVTPLNIDASDASRAVIDITPIKDEDPE